MTYRDILAETPCFVRNHVGTYFIAIEDKYINSFIEKKNRLKIVYINKFDWSYNINLQLKSNLIVVNLKDVPIEILEKGKNTSLIPSFFSDKIKEEIVRRK